LREEVLATLRRSLGDLGEKLEGVGTTAFGRVRTCQAVGDLLVKLGQGEEALRVYQRGYTLAKQVADADPRNDVARGNLGVMLLRLGDVALNLKGDARSALAYYRRARDLHEAIRSRPRSGFYKEIDLKRILSHDDMHVGQALLALGQPAKAKKAFHRSLTYRQAWVKAMPKLVEARSYVMEAHMWLGITAGHLADARGVREHFSQSLRIGEELVKQAPNYVPFKADLAEVQGAFGDALLSLGKVDAAHNRYEESLRNQQLVIARDPDDLAALTFLALTHERLGTISIRQGKRPQAEKHYGEALKLRGELLRIEPNSLSRQAAYLLALAHCGKYAEATGGAAKLQPHISKSTQLLLQLTRCSAVCAAADTSEKGRYAAQAMEALTMATRDDYQDAVVLQTDPDLEGIRATGAFKAVLAQVKSRQKVVSKSGTDR
jgi:tetratricopeptide (TPR) repeat protein